MQWPPYTLSAQDPTEYAAELLAESHVTDLPVLDENNHLVGIISEADLIGDPTEGPATVPDTVGGVMTRDVISMSPGSDIERLTHWLLTLNLRVMPITNSCGRFLGVVDRMSLMRHIHPPATRPGWNMRPVPRIQQRSPGGVLRAGDIMTTRDLVAAPETATVEDAMEMLEEYQFTALPVVDRKGHLVGIVSGADLIPDPRGETISSPRRRRLTAPRTVGSVMTADVVTGRPESDLADLAHWLFTMGRRVMPIVDNDHRLVGVVTRSDLMRVRDELNLHAGLPVAYSSRVER